ncbi:MAG: 1-deoxy-D-xylulose-5-phosphate synthase [Oscillospiraceae bacterium]|nr:1-deoxy-D-xylulose-5-phosphate synthase [Oscillospiraceae bacterium]
MSKKYLENIKSPADIKSLSYEQLDELAGEIRETLIDTVSKTGGHLASNLGVVELTLAIHKEFDSPKDKIVWDVGHQSYTHKLLTGRYERFSTLRQEGGISGFCRPDESEHDIFYSGHSSTSVSSALGLSIANSMHANDDTVIAVVGDGSMTGGMFYEALNNAGRTRGKFIIVLNDNEMSISENVGSIARYLAAVRAKPEYYRMKARTETVLNRIPLIGEKLSHAAFEIKSTIKRLIYSQSWFEDLGLHYIGPIDGHNIRQLCEGFEMAKRYSKPILLHVNTLKGKGYDYAERSPEQFHGISKFDINTGEPLSTGMNFSNIFGDLMCELASKDERICAITAAMSIGTGLARFSNEYKKRFFDIGIAEEHAVAFALGLSKNGFIPVFAVYSTFLQRCFDQLLHDAALQNQKIVIAIDRAGFVGEDGETHQGIFDVSMLRSVPGITVYSPSTYEDLKYAMERAIYSENKLVAVRYPRGAQRAFPEDVKLTFGDCDILGDKDSEIAIITYGRTFSSCANAHRMLKEEGINTKVIKLNKIIPVCDEAIAEACCCEKVFFVEEGIQSGGVGEGFLSSLYAKGFSGKYILRAIEDGFVKQASVNALLHEYGLDEDGICNLIKSEL